MQPDAVVSVVSNQGADIFMGVTYWKVPLGHCPAKPSQCDHRAIRSEESILYFLRSCNIGEKGM